MKRARIVDENQASGPVNSDRIDVDDVIYGALSRRRRVDHACAFEREHRSWPLTFAAYNRNCLD